MPPYWQVQFFCLFCSSSCQAKQGGRGGGGAVKREREAESERENKKRKWGRRERWGGQWGGGKRHSRRWIGKATDDTANTGPKVLPTLDIKLGLSYLFRTFSCSCFWSLRSSFQTPCLFVLISFIAFFVFLFLLVDSPSVPSSTKEKNKETMFTALLHSV